MLLADASLTRARVIKAPWLAGAFLVCSSGALAQVRDLTGTVSDRSHEPLKGAVVQVHNESTGSVLSFITDRSGHYTFKRLDSNTEYRVWATYSGHRSRAKDLSSFNTQRTATINIVIKLR